MVDNAELFDREVLYQKEKIIATRPDKRRSSRDGINGCNISDEGKIDDYRLDQE